MRNAWCTSKENHPDGWALDEILQHPRQRVAESQQGNSPEAWAWFQSLKIKFSMAQAAGGAGLPDVWPLPS